MTSRHSARSGNAKFFSSFLTKFHHICGCIGLCKMCENKIVFPVPGIGPRRENQSWYNLRDRDIWMKAGANGKRLQTILESYLEQNPKRAVQELDKLIKKHGASAPFSAVKAIAHHRLDHSSPKSLRSSQALIESIPVNADLDDLTIFVVVHYYQHETADYEGLHRFLQKVLALSSTPLPLPLQPQQQQVKKGGVSIGVLEMIATTYMRQHSAKETQRVAMELAKLDAPNADRHYMLAVFSLITQAMECSEASRMRSMLSLAYRTLDKRFPLNQPRDGNGRHEHSLKLWTLWQMGDVSAFRQVLDAPPPHIKSDDDDCVASQADFVLWFCELLLRSSQKGDNQSLEQFDRMISCVAPQDVGLDIVAALVERHLIGLDMKVSDHNEHDGHLVDSSIQSALSSLASLTFHATKGLQMVAKLQYYRGLLQRSSTWDEPLQGQAQSTARKTAVDVLVDYFHLLGSRSCFYDDVSPFLSLLDPQSAQELLKRIGASENDVSIDLQNTHNCQHEHSVSQIILHQNQLIMQYVFHQNLSSPSNDAAAEWAYVEKLLGLRVLASETERSRAQASANGRNMEESIWVGDVYASLAVYRLFDLYASTGDCVYLSDAIVALECMLNKPKPHLCSETFRFLLIHLYLHCGAIESAHQQFARLDIKSLQLSPLLYVILPALVVCGASPASTKMLDDCIRFFTGTLFEAYESQMQCINRSQYYRLLNLENLKRKLKHSDSFVLANHAYLWSLPLHRQVSDNEMGSWWSDTERFVGGTWTDQNLGANWRQAADRELLPSWSAHYSSAEPDQKPIDLEKGWLTVMRLQMMTVQLCMSVASVYSRYNPWEKEQVREQLLDHVSTSAAEKAGQLGQQLTKTQGDYFDLCKQQTSSMQSKQKEKVRHMKDCLDYYLNPLPVYLSLGCHAVLLRLSHLVLAVNKVLADTVRLNGGRPAFDGEAEAPKVEEAPDEAGDHVVGNKVDQSLDDALSAAEMTLKLDQMMEEIWREFEASSPTDLTRFRRLLVSLTLFNQAISCTVWTLECLAKSLAALVGCVQSNAKLKAAGDVRKVVEDWATEFASYLNSFSTPLEDLHKKMDAIIQTDLKDFYQADIFAHHILHPSSSESLFCQDEPQDQQVEKVFQDAQARLKSSWKASLVELDTVLLRNVQTLRHNSEQLRASCASKKTKPAQTEKKPA